MTGLVDAAIKPQREPPIFDPGQITMPLGAPLSTVPEPSDAGGALRRVSAARNWKLS